MKTKFIFMNTPSEAALERTCHVLINGLNKKLRDIGSDTELTIKELIPKSPLKGEEIEKIRVQSGA